MLITPTNTPLLYSLFYYHSGVLKHRYISINEYKQIKNK